MRISYLTLITLFMMNYSSLSYSADGSVFLGTPYQTKQGQVPACTALTAKNGKKATEFRDVNKSWPKFSIDNASLEVVQSFSDFSECLKSTQTYEGRYTQEHIANFLLGNLSPGMPYEFASMLLGPIENQTVSSYLDPNTGENKTYTFYVWTNQKKRSMLGAAVAVAGAATGLGAAAGAISAVQVASVATTAASAAYSIESLRAYKMVTIQVDDTGTIQSFSSN
jgi:hypothetical protein